MKFAIIEEAMFSNYKILIIEDNDDDKFLIKEYLISGNIPEKNILFATTLNEANEIILSSPFLDLILLDLSLPDVAGLMEIEEFITKMNKYPLIILTGRQDESFALKLIKKGAQDYILKSEMNERVLLRAIRYSFERNKLLSEILVINKNREKLLSVISHDLRSPWSGILILLKSIQEDIEDITKEELNEYLGYLLKSTEKSLHLLEDLLRWSVATTGHMKVENSMIHVRTMVDATLSYFKENIKKKNLSVKLDISKDLKGYSDDNIVSTILRNLLSNGIKFSPEGGEICIYARRENKKIHLFIEDNGEGFSEETRESILSGGTYRIHKGTGGEKGTGLGLSLCREFINLIDGDLDIQIKKERGVIFSFKFPALEA